MSIFGAVKERSFSLIETGEYVLTLNDLTEESGQYGDAIKFVWLVAPVSDPTNYICNGNGMERTLHAYTDADITIGGQNHEWVQVLTGRQFSDGDDPPHEDDLLGKRMIAYITHQAPKKGPNAGKLREKIVPGSAKPFRGIPPKKIAPNVVHQAAVSEDAEDAENRAKLIAEATRQISKARKFETPSAETWASIDLTELADDALHMVIRDTKDEIQVALED